MKAILVAAMLVASTVASQAAYICNDNASEANVRSGPSAQTFPVIDKVDNGYPVIVTGTTYNAAGFLWARVRYNSMRYGYPTVESGWIDGGSVCN